MNKFIILFGSNSDAENNMAEACSRLTSAFQENILFSEIHRSAAVVKQGQPIPQGEHAIYLNAICLVHSTKNLQEVQLFLKQTETEMGRVRGPEACGGVVIDLDLVEWNGDVLRPKDASQPYYQNCLADIKH